MSDAPYTVQLSRQATDSLNNLDKVVAQSIRKKLEWLALNADEFDHFAMKGQWRGYYRIRIGNYRAIYRLNHEKRLVIVEVIGHRREVYDD